MEVHIAQTLFDAVNTATKTQLGNVTQVMKVMGIVVGAGWIVYILLKALTWYFMAVRQVVEDIVMTMIKAGFIMFMAFKVDWYISTVVPVVTDFPVWLGNTISGTSGVNNNLVDSLISSYLTSVVELIKAMDVNPLTHFMETLYGVMTLLFLLMGGLPFLAVAVGTLITLKCASSLLLVIGPVFIALSLFPRLQGYFWGWTGVLGGFALAQALFAVVIGMEISFINNNIVKGGVIDTDFITCVSLLLYFGAFTMLATEIPNYAAAIMGGSQAGSASAGNLVSRNTGLNAATKMGGKFAKALMGMRGNKIK